MCDAICTFHIMKAVSTRTHAFKFWLFHGSHILILIKRKGTDRKKANIVFGIKRSFCIFLQLILFIVAKVVLARPQLDLPPLVGPPPVQIFVPDLHFVNEPEAPQPAPSAPLPQPPSTRPPPPPPPPPLPPQSAARISEAPYIDYKLKFSNVGDIVGYSYV